MRKLMLLAGVAALGAAIPAIAMEDQGRGGGHGKGDRVERGGGDRAGQGRGNGQAERNRGRGGDRAARQGRGNDRAGRAQRRADRAESRVERRADRAERRVDRGRQRAERAIQAERRQVRDARRDVRRFDRDRADDRLVRVDRDWRGWADRRLDSRHRFVSDLVRFRDGRRLAVGPSGCPPGLANKNPLCMPPGQYRKAQLIGRSLPLFGLGYNVPDRFGYRFMDDDDWLYRYDDGYVYRFDRDSRLVDRIFPLYGNDLLIGEPLPLGYEVYNVPLAYRGYYPDSRDHYYRYDDGAIYAVDPDTRMVEGVVSLLTGGYGGLGSLGVGDRLPLGYDVYNVPMAYRGSYYDTPNSMYRYADNYIYQVDPQTRMIEAIISLLV